MALQGIYFSNISFNYEYEQTPEFKRLDWYVRRYAFIDFGSPFSPSPTRFSPEWTYWCSKSAICWKLFNECLRMVVHILVPFVRERTGDEGLKSYFQWHVASIWPVSDVCSCCSAAKSTTNRRTCVPLEMSVWTNSVHMFLDGACSYFFLVLISHG